MLGSMGMGRLGFGRFGRLGGASAFTPASLFTGGELGGYYDPADLATAVDSAVSSFTDLSGNGNHATQATGAAQPIRRLTGSVYSIEFDGNDHLELPTGLLTGWTSGTAVFAAKLDADPPATGGVSGPVLGDIGSAADSNHYPFTDGIVYEDFLSTARKATVDPGNMAAWHVTDFRSEANNWRAAFNGTEFFTTATNTVGVGTAPLIGRSAAAGVNFDGHVGRIIIINRILTASELTDARSWVAEGAGVTL